jgi:hypothetical protein
MAERRGAAPVRATSTGLPDWVVTRAAAYMVRCYGVEAHARATARHTFLRDNGYEEAAGHWIEVAAAVATLLKSGDDLPSDDQI